MSKPRKVTPEMAASLVSDRRRLHTSYPALGHKYGVSTSKAHTICRAAGIPLERRSVGRPHRFPPAREQEIAGKCRTAPLRQVAREVGCTVPFLRTLCRRFGVQLLKKTWKLTPEAREQVSVDYLTGDYSLDTLAARYGVTPPAIRQILIKRGVPRRRQGLHGRHCRLNEAAFDTATPQAAYWTGWLTADGGVTHDRGMQPRVVSSVKYSDRAHLVSLRDFLGSTHAICDWGRDGGSPTQSTLQVRSSRLAAALSKFGVVPRKSGRESVQLLAHDRDFWRGVVDGDGCLQIAQRPRRGRRIPTPRLALVGSKRLLEQFLEFARSIWPTKATVRPHRGGVVYLVALTTRACVAVTRVLYADAEVALARKRLRAKEIVRQFGSRYARRAETGPR